MFFEHKLSNGIRIIGQKMPHLHSVSVGIWVGVGSVKESANEAGLTHFIEHMLFKGTERRNAQEIAAEMDSIGAQINAFTAKECTCYYIKATDDRLPECLDMLGDIVLHSLFEPKELQKEKGVVLEEILMNEDNPEDVAMEEVTRAYYGEHPLGRPILGNKESVSAFEREDLVAFMQKHYKPSDILIAIAGNFDSQQLLDLVNQYFGQTTGEQPAVYPDPPIRPQKKLLHREKDIEQMHISLALPGYGANHSNYYPLLIISNALGGSMSSRLFQKIREEMGMAYAVFSYTSSYRDSGTLGLYAGTNPNTAYDVVGLMVDEIHSIRKNGITQEEFVRSKAQLRGSFVLSSESSGSRMSSIGKNKLLYDKAYTEEEILAKLDHVTYTQLESVLEDVFDTEAMCGALVGRTRDDSDKIPALW